MDSTAQVAGVKEISLIESLDLDSWIKLPLLAMQEVGPAVQTLGGLLKVSNKETFGAVETIAESARQPIKTTRKHLVTLDRFGWIVNCGRKRTRAGRPRRTCTITVTAKTKEAAKSYGILPWWTCATIRTIGRTGTGRRGTYKMPWCAKAVLSIILARLASMVKVVKEQVERADLSPEQMADAIANFASEDWRWQWSGEQLAVQTGLDRKSVITGKHWLFHHGIIRLESTVGPFGGSGRDRLEPSDTFRLVKTPVKEGSFYLDFQS